MIYSKTKTNGTLKLAVMQQSFCFLFKKYNKSGFLWQKNNDFSRFSPESVAFCCSPDD